jgi:hypothetical protein
MCKCQIIVSELKGYYSKVNSEGKRKAPLIILLGVGAISLLVYGWRRRTK